MSVLRIFLFGRFHAEYASQTISGLDAPKVQELLCYLLLNRDRPHPREALANLLWNERRTDQPNRCLRKTLWQLRSSFDAQSEALSGQVLLVEPDWIQLSPQADLWLDVGVFEQTFHQVQRFPGSELDARTVQSIDEAIHLYRGGLQECWYQDWYLYERERFRHTYLMMLDKLMDYCEAHGRYAAGLDYGTLILDCEPARERTHRRLMRLHYLAGDRTMALRQYETCVEVLNNELSVEPARRTVALIEKIRADRLNIAASNAMGADGGSTALLFLLPQVLHSLGQLQEVLAQAQEEIDQDLRVLESALKNKKTP